MLGHIAIERMKTSRSFLLGLLESLSDEHLAARAGAAGNHALWVMGHIAQSDDVVASAFTGEPGCLPDGHSELFAAKTSLSDNAADYPSRDELLLRMTTSRKRVDGWITSLDDQSALQPSPIHLAAFAPNPIAAAIGISQHEFLHAGQIATVRASLGLKPVYQ
ncbi:DinB family protein [Rubinisphaera italica]|uniref:DinB superfamily protein n=1 Tax=Rubinisphaera italica TaxID=2527969 RepID=A0A5C5XDT5_9PLAN|nr:DinB family protein [Rubinisphaera italica]TWT60944.1 DinB superfamily protein [Rubinisphaera italica]